MEKEIVAFLKNFDGNCDFQTYLELYKRLEEAGEKGCYFTGNDSLCRPSFSLGICKKARHTNQKKRRVPGK